MNDFLTQTLQKVSIRKKSNNRFFDAVQFSWILNPLIQTFLWISAVAAGAWASLDSVSIMSFQNPLTHFANGIHVKSVLYFGFLLIVTLLFATSAWVKTQKDSYVIDSLLTMPPVDFWVKFGEQFNVANDVIETDTLIVSAAVTDFKSAKKPTDKAKAKDKLVKEISKYENDIRRILDTIINLVKLWDTNNLLNEKVIYRANIMRIYRWDDSNVPFENLLAVSNRFAVGDIKKHHSGFVAILDNTFTTTTISKAPDPDEIEPIGFPFTDLQALPEQPFKMNILGAPEAAATGTYSYVKYPQEIVTRYQKSDNVNQKVLKNLTDYYSNSEKADSILSIPILDPQTDKAIFILNIYRNQSGLLFSGHKARDFSRIVLPFTSLIRTGLIMIQTAKEL